MAYDDFEWLMSINFWGVVHGTKAFLPHLKAAGEGHIVNLSSVFGLISVPSQSRTTPRSSACGVHRHAPNGARDRQVRRVVDHRPPGGIKTNIVRNSRLDESTLAMAGSVDEAARQFDKAAMTSPEKAARQILAAVEKNQRRALIGPDAKAIDLISGCRPACTSAFWCSEPNAANADPRFARANPVAQPPTLPGQRSVPA